MNPQTTPNAAAWLVPGLTEQDFYPRPARHGDLFRDPNGPKALIIEVEGAMLVSMTEILLALGVRVTTASDRATAVEWIERERFDGIFAALPANCDEGVELVRKIRASWWNARAPIVVIGGRDTKSTTQALIAGGTLSASQPMDRGALMRMLSVARSAMMVERRRVYRPGIPIIAECESGSSRFAAEILEVREDGLLLSIDESVTAGVLVRIRFTPDGALPVIEAWAETWCSSTPGCLGTQFKNLDWRDRERLRSFIQRENCN